MCCRQFVLPTARVITRLTTQNANFPSPAGGVVDYHEVVHRDPVANQTVELILSYKRITTSISTANKKTNRIMKMNSPLNLVAFAHPTH